MDLSAPREYATVINRRLIATVTEPLATPINRTAILLNSGVLQRSGMGRLQVRIARELSAMGYHCVRVDYSGVGDSPRQKSSGSQYDRWVEEAISAVDYAHNELKTDATVIIGNCTGGEIAVRVASADERVTDVVALNTEGTYKIGARKPLSYFLRCRLFSLPAWVSKTQQLLGVPRRQVQGAPMLVGYEPTLNDDDWRKFDGRKTRVLFGFSSYDPRCDIFRKRVAPIFSEAISKGRCRIRVFGKADHLFTPEAAKKQLIDELKTWLRPARAAEG